MITVIAGRVKHDCGMRVTLKFPYDQGVNDLVRKLPDAKWSQRMQCWHIADSDDVITLLLRTLSEVVFVDYTALTRLDLAGRVSGIRKERQEVNLRARGPGKVPFTDLADANNEQGESVTTPGILSQKGKDDIADYKLWLEAHRYPPTTVRTYTSMMEAFLRFVSPREASECSASDLIRMVNEYIL